MTDKTKNKKMYNLAMRGSVVLFGSTQQNRQLHACEIISKEIDQKINWNYLQTFPDIKIVSPLEDKKNISIAQIREVIKFLHEKPLALEIKAVVITKAHTMRDEAQNAFLKTLEETPSYGLIILLSKTEGALLPTVLSRCRKIKTFDKFSGDSTIAEKIKTEHIFSYVLNLDKGKALDWAEATAKEERDDVINILEKWIESGREMLIDPDTNLAKKNELVNWIEHINKTLDDLENTNVLTRLALEELLLNR